MSLSGRGLSLSAIFKAWIHPSRRKVGTGVETYYLSTIAIGDQTHISKTVRYRNIRDITNP